MLESTEHFTENELILDVVIGLYSKAARKKDNRFGMLETAVKEADKARKAASKAEKVPAAPPPETPPLGRPPRRGKGEGKGGGRGDRKGGGKGEGDAVVPRETVEDTPPEQDPAIQQGKAH